MNSEYNKNPGIDPRACVVFFDFDNTITSLDVLDDMLLRFSKNERWVGLEEKWKEGEIGSKECLQGQVEGLRITKRVLDKYLSGIKLDPYFKKLVAFLNSRGVRSVILSDNFDYILKRILNNHEVERVKIYSNVLRFDEDALIPAFPYESKECPLCAHCKTKNLLENARNGSIIIYIGDGSSDTCPAEYADVVFAKKDLLEHCKAKNLQCIKYDSLKEVYNYLKARSLFGTPHVK